MPHTNMMSLRRSEKGMKVLGKIMDAMVAKMVQSAAFRSTMEDSVVNTRLTEQGVRLSFQFAPGCNLGGDKITIVTDLLDSVSKVLFPSAYWEMEAVDTDKHEGLVYLLLEGQIKVYFVEEKNGKEPID